jgi:hypothetical protein
MALLGSSLVLAIPPASAQGGTQWSWGGSWTSSVTVADLTGNSPVAQSQAFLAGHSYNITLQISVPITQTNVQFQVSLLSNLTQAPGQSQYFVVKTPKYGGYNGSTFTGGTKVVTFSQVMGTLGISAYFQIPTTFTNQSASYAFPNAKVTRFADLTQNVNALISVVPIGGSEAGHLSATVQDQSIQRYLVLYNQTSNLVPTGKISQSYAPLVTSVLAEAQALYALGYPQQGINLLDTITPSAFPAPPNNSLTTYLIGGLGVAVVVIILLAVLMVRSRGKSGYSAGIVGEVSRDLAVLEVTAAKYDKAMADKIKSLRDKLGETS